MAPSLRRRRLRRLALAAIEGDLVARLDAVGKARLDLGERDRRGEQDAALRRALPASSATARKGSRASGEAGSTLAPRPFTSKNAPAAPPRFLAMRSG